MTGKNWAIIVGINEYEHLPSDDHLKYAVKDALAMQAFLCDQAQFPADNVLVCCDSPAGGTRRPSRSGLRDLLRNRLQPARGADNFWFFYAGHGIVHNHQDFLLPCDGNPYDLEETALPISFVTDCLRDCEAQNVVLVLDMCRNRTRSTVEDGTRDVNATVGEQTLELARAHGIVTLFSCSRGQRSYEIAALEQGAFTHTLLSGLKESTTPRVLEQYLTNRVPALNRQYGKPVQVPLVVPEPGWKYDRPLLLSAATLFDLSLLAVQARDAELDEDYDLAESLWWQVIEVERSTASERATARKALGRLGAKRRVQPQPQQTPQTEPQPSLETESGSSQAVPPNESSQSSPTTPALAQQASQAPLASQDFDGQSVKKDFFISYDRHDQHWAEWLAWTLEEAGYTVVLQAWDFRPGSNSVLDVQRATAECEKTIAVLSEPYLKAAYTQSEWATAFAGDPQSLKRTLIPMRVGECRPEGVLKTIVYVDLVGVTAVEAKDLVLGALKERAKPAQEPSFPGAVIPKVERTEPAPVAFPGAASTVKNLAAPSLQPLIFPFIFKVVTVNSKGQLVNTEEWTADSFQEDLGYGSRLEMVAIPSGMFLMGAPSAERGSEDRERPQHLVRVSPFFIGKYPVTQEQWFTVSDLPKVNCDLDPNCSLFKGLKRPVESVSWFEAVEFCDRLSHGTGREYRLPTEAEWEYTCRASTTTPFHFGETMTTDLANYNGNWTSASEPKGISRNQTTNVGCFPPNTFGLCDMHGNILEWCLDYEHENYEGSPTDGTAWVIDGDSDLRLLRGGSWDDGAENCRSACRYDLPPDKTFSYVGFRVVCSDP